MRLQDCFINNIFGRNQSMDGDSHQVKVDVDNVDVAKGVFG